MNKKVNKKNNVFVKKQKKSTVRKKNPTPDIKMVAPQNYQCEQVS